MPKTDNGDWILELILAGKSKPQIIRITGLTPNTVDRRWDKLAKSGLCPPRPRCQRSAPNPLRDEILRRMRLNQKDRDIFNALRVYGVTRAVISGLRIRSKIPPHLGDPVFIINPLTTPSSFRPRMGEEFRKFLLEDILKTRQDEYVRLKPLPAVELETFKGWEHYGEGGPMVFDDLEADQCRYPIGETDPHVFCGCQKAPNNRNYCSFHAELIHDRSATAQARIKSATRIPRNYDHPGRVGWRSDAREFAPKRKRINDY